MAYNFVIMVDAEEGNEVLTSQIYYAYTENDVDKKIPHLSSQNPNATICVYRLHELRKIKTKPTYSVYGVNEKFEVTPK